MLYLKVNIIFMQGNALEVYLRWEVYSARIRRIYNTKLHIARERNKLATHFKKWEKLVAALNT